MVVWQCLTDFDDFFQSLLSLVGLDTSYIDFLRKHLYIEVNLIFRRERGLLSDYRTLILMVRNKDYILKIRLHDKLNSLN